MKKEGAEPVGIVQVKENSLKLKNHKVLSR